MIQGQSPRRIEGLSHQRDRSGCPIDLDELAVRETGGRSGDADYRGDAELAGDDRSVAVLGADLTTTPQGRRTEASTSGYGFLPVASVRKSNVMSIATAATLQLDAIVAHDRNRLSQPGSGPRRARSAPGSADLHPDLAETGRKLVRWRPITPVERGMGQSDDDA